MAMAAKGDLLSSPSLLSRLFRFGSHFPLSVHHHISRHFYFEAPSNVEEDEEEAGPHSTLEAPSPKSIHSTPPTFFSKVTQHSFFWPADL
jgi:hypothetical protein